MKTLADYENSPFLVFAFPDYRDDACYIMLAESALESLENAKLSSLKPPVSEVSVPVPYLEIVDSGGIEEDANVPLGRGVGVVTAYRLWNYGIGEDEPLGFDTGACETFDTVRLQLRAARNGYEFRAVASSDHEGLKGGAYEYTPWIELEKLAGAVEKTMRIAREKEQLQR